MNRRIFLRGVGGAVVAAPFLSSIYARGTKGQTVSPPRQLIVMFTHYGCVTTKFFPVKSHGALAASDLAPTSLAILTPYLGKLLIPRGIRAMNEWTQNNDGVHGLGQGNDPHLQVTASYFTCQPVTPNSNDPFSFSQDTKFNAKAVGSSLDHVMAQQLSASGTPLFLRVGNSGGTNGESPQSNISYLKDPGAAAGDAAAIYPGLGTPMQVFSMLTGLLGPGPTTPDTYAAARGKKVTDLVKADLEALERLDMSAADRNKLEAWKALINDTGSAMTSALCTADLAAALGATADNVAAASAGPTTAGSDYLTQQITADLDGADMYSVMAVLATACNFNPVIVLKYPPNYYFRGLGITNESENLSVRSSNANLSGLCYPNALEELEIIDKYYASKLAKLAGMLDGIKNPDGSTLLDSTAAVWFNEMSDGLAMNTNNLPIVQVGGCGGYFKTGWTVNVEDGSPTLTQGNSEAQCGPGSNGMTDGIDKGTGTDPSLANAPINKYFCNLMNAMGVKGDVNGFPAKGGTEEVARFGYSDLTTDFCGGFGAVADARIHDPGEFTALKAG